MKKKFITFATMLMTGCLCLGTMTACEQDFEDAMNEVGGFFEGIVNDVFDDGIYDISYTDENGTHTLQVAKGESFTVSTIPEKYGYEFIGLFDAEEGGTQYTDAQGRSLEPYTNKQDIVLYPHYTALEYTIYFYNDEVATETDEKTVVSFGESILYVPTSFDVEGKNFVGWYTEPDGQGTQVAGTSGMLLEYKTMNRELSEFMSEDGRGIPLYAKFEWKQYAVVAHFANGDTVTQLIQHGASINDVAEFWEIHANSVVTAWKTENTADAAVFDGIVLGDVELYPATIKYEITLTFNGNGGFTPAAQVVKIGETVSLPSSSRTDYKFNGWRTSSGSLVTALTAGGKDLTLTADWTRTRAVYSKSSSLTIEDEHSNKNPYDAVSMNGLFGKTVGQLRSEGFTTISVSFRIRIEEKNDGYQEIYFGRSTYMDVDNSSGGDRLWGKSNIETSGSQTFSASASYSLSSFNDTMYFAYSANGALGDTWYRKWIEAEFVIS